MVLEYKKGYGPILLELLPFVILNVFCLLIDSAYAGKSTCTTTFAETIWYFAFVWRSLMPKY